MAAREILDSVGYGQKYANEIIGKVHRIGNNLGLPGPALNDTLEGLEEDVKDATGIDVRFPIDVKGAEVLLITPSADFFAEPHIDSLIGYAKVFHATGTSWTLSSMASEAGNFGMFIGNYDQLRTIALRIREAALELGVKRIVVGECGHAWPLPTASGTPSPVSVMARTRRTDSRRCCKSSSTIATSSRCIFANSPGI
jgi:hypothetical protein